MHWRLQKIFHGLSNIKHALTDSVPYRVDGSDWQARLKASAGELGFKITEMEEVYRLQKELHPIYLRKQGSDAGVFIEIFTDGEYSSLLHFIKINQIPIVNLMDIGANIGLATRYFCQHLPIERVVCVEPFAPNLVECRRNTAGLQNVAYVEKAVWKESNSSLHLHRHFRDGNDWSIATSEKGGTLDAGTVEAITLEKLMQETGMLQVDLLKVDIEGAEQVLFSDKADLSCLGQVKVICIELHREMIGYKKIFPVLRSCGFSLFETGNLLMGFRNA
jgi:FkbM family methyltransferase